MTAIGAAAQILPVATRRPLAAGWLVKLVFWFMVAGTTMLIVGMYTAQQTALRAGACCTAVGLILFAWLLASSLRYAGSIPIVAAHGWAALTSLIVLAALGVALAFNDPFEILPSRTAVAVAQMLLGGFGFMGLLALGFSHILIPMFALAPFPSFAPSLANFATAITAVVLGTVGALVGSRTVLTSAAVLALATAAGYLWLMYRVLATGMRKHLGLPFLLVRLAWVMLLITVLTGFATLWGFLLPQRGDPFWLSAAVRLAPHLLVGHLAAYPAVPRLHARGLSR